MILVEEVTGMCRTAGHSTGADGIRTVCQEATLLVAENAEQLFIKFAVSSVLVLNGVLEPNKRWLTNKAVVRTAAANC